MNYPLFAICVVVISFVCGSFSVYSQDTLVISGRATDENNQPLQNASIHLVGVPGGTMTKADGSFAIGAAKWTDTLEVTNTGFEKLEVALRKNETSNLALRLKSKAEQLQNVIVNAKMMDKEPGKRFMKKVIANKVYNNPDRFSSYSYQQYKRHELDVSNLDTTKTSSKGFKNLTLSIYRNTDSVNAKSSVLPLYFSETI